MQPTLPQLVKTYILACNLTRFYRTIDLVRLDRRTRFVVILAGEEYRDRSVPRRFLELLAMDKPDFQNMPLNEFKRYILDHRADDEAFHTYMERSRKERTWSRVYRDGEEEQFMADLMRSLEQRQGNEGV